MLDELIQKIQHQLTKRKKTIAIAESCTGGQLSSLLTSLPGSSKYFLLGAITYSSKSKRSILGIPKKIINQHGAVSQPVAILMAQNIRRKINADFGLSITGIAGPKGSTPTKPIGTTYICLSVKNKTICQKFIFSGNRKDVRRKSVQSALRLLCAHLSL